MTMCIRPPHRPSLPSEVSLWNCTRRRQVKSPMKEPTAAQSGIGKIFFKAKAQAQGMSPQLFLTLLEVPQKRCMFDLKLK